MSGLRHIDIHEIISQYGTSYGCYPNSIFDNAHFINNLHSPGYVAWLYVAEYAEQTEKGPRLMVSDGLAIYMWEAWKAARKDKEHESD